MNCKYDAHTWFNIRNLVKDLRGPQYSDRRKVMNKLDNMGQDHFEITGCDCYLKLLAQSKPEVE